MTALLTAVRAVDVRPADRIDHGGQALTVRYVESGGNRQVYVATVTESGVPVVLERYPSEVMSVWRVSGE